MNRAKAGTLTCWRPVFFQGIAARSDLVRPNAPPRKNWFNRWIWNPLGHVFRAHAGLRILGLSGLIEAAWRAAVALLISGSITMWGHVHDYPWPLLIALGLLLFVGTLVAINVVRPTARISQPSTSGQDGLVFAGCDAGASRNMPRWGDGVVTVIEVRNTSSKVPVVAQEVLAQIQFSNAGGSQRLTVPNAIWYAITQTGSIRCAGWCPSVNLDASETQCFVLFVNKEDGRLWVYRDNASPLGVLEYGGWEVVIRVTAENMEGFEGTLNFTISKFGGFQFDTWPAFVLRQRLAPRFSK